MSNGESAFAPSEHFGELGKRWKWLLGFGVLTVVLGLIGLGMATFLTLASVVFYGVILLADGVVQFVQSFQSAGWKAKLWHILISLLYVFGGIIVIRNPILASGILTLLLLTAGTIIFSAPRRLAASDGRRVFALGGNPPLFAPVGHERDRPKLQFPDRVAAGLDRRQEQDVFLDVGGQA